MKITIQSIKFDATEKLTEYTEKKIGKLERFIEAESAEVVFKVTKPQTANNKEVTLNLGLLRTEDTVNAPDNAAESNFSNITMNWSSARNYNNSGTSTIAATNGNIQGLGTGKALGALTGISINGDGTIYGSYDNGNTVCLGQIAVAQFANVSGLEKAGDNLYSATLNSGEFDGVGVDITANGDKMSTGQLEMSNVDLSQEFTEMITTQRGFQANSRIITVSDTLLEELTNLKR